MGALTGEHCREWWVVLNGILIIECDSICELCVFEGASGHGHHILEDSGPNPSLATTTP